MSDKKAIPVATCDKEGRVVCPICMFKIPVPETHSLSQGLGVCPNGHRFLIDGECVAAFHHFLRKQRSAAGQHSGQMLQNTEDTPKLLKDIQDEISEGGIIKP
jgi:hypothetical protein